MHGVGGWGGAPRAGGALGVPCPARGSSPVSASALVHGCHLCARAGESGRCMPTHCGVRLGVTTSGVGGRGGGGGCAVHSPPTARKRLPPPRFPPFAGAFYLLCSGRYVPCGQVCVCTPATLSANGCSLCGSKGQALLACHLAFSLAAAGGRVMGPGSSRWAAPIQRHCVCLG